MNSKQVADKFRKTYVLNEIDTRSTSDVKLWIPGASDSDDPDDDAKYIQSSLKRKGVKSKVTVSIDEFYVDLQNPKDIKKAEKVLDDLGYQYYSKRKK